jgi:hypothetical protein
MNEMSSDSEVCLIPERVTEEDIVTEWRVEQFSLLGFDLGDAVRLADSDADLNRARKLVADGCPLSVALQILL